MTDPDGVSTPAKSVEELLSAAQKGELDLAAVNLEEIVNDFERRHLASESPDPAALADFLGTAARLVQLKAASLLPGADPEPSDEADQEGPPLADELARRQELYLLYRSAAERLLAWHDSEQLSFPGMPLGLEDAADEMELDLGSLVSAFQRVLRRLPAMPEMTVVQPAYTVEDKASEIRAALVGAGGRLSFIAVLERARDRLEAVALFLALLEMFKQRVITVRQAAPGADIEVKLR